MSQIYNLKTVGSRTPSSAAEGKSGVHLLSFKIRQQEQHAQPYSPQTQHRQQQLSSEKIRIQQENQELELKLKYLCSQETHKQSAANQAVQFRQLQLEEQSCQRTQKLTQHHRKIQQDDQQLEDQRSQLKDEETHHKQKTPWTLQHLTKRKTHPKQYQLNQFNSCTAFTGNLQPSSSLENPGGSITSTQTPPLLPSSSPSPSPSLPLFSLRNVAAAQSKKGNTITINPRKSGGVASVKAPGEMRSSHSVPDPAAHGVREECKKRYPTAEEIEVIGGYQSLDKSCLAKSRGTQKGVKVCFDEVQLEVVFEYPSESSLLASFPVPLFHAPTEKGRRKMRKTKRRRREYFCS